MDKSALVGLLSGLTVVVLTLIMVGIVNTPAAEGAVSAKARVADCRQVQVAQDAGYEISQRVARRVCQGR